MFNSMTSIRERIESRRCRYSLPLVRTTGGLLLLSLATSAAALEPSPPGDLRYAVYSGEAAEIFWDRADDDGLVVAYEIVVNGSVIDTRDVLSYYSDTLVAGQTYDIVVTSIDDEGMRSTPATVSFIAGNTSNSGSSGEGDGSLVASPKGLTASLYSSSSGEIMWDRPEFFGLTYEVSRNGSVLTVTDGISYYDNQLAGDNTYEYAVVAIDPQGNRSAASTVTLQTGDGGGSSSDAVAPPAGLTASVYSSTSAEIFWDRPDAFGLTHDVSRNGSLLITTDGISYYDDQLSADMTYTYEVVAIDLLGQRSTASTIMINTSTSSGGGTSGGGSEGGGDPTDEPAIPSPSIPPLANDPNIVEPSDLYTRDGYYPADVIRVDLRTVTSEGPCNADDESGCTLADVLADVDKFDDHTVDIAVHFSSDDFPDVGSISNAELRLRGGGSRFAPQKSFRIKLDSKDDLWRDERYLQINKHPFETSRIRNKLAMDVMSEIPNLPSLRTQFVNLWIDDGDGPEDYGLFTHVERVNEDFLEKRGWDDDDNIYKAEYFRFNESDLNNLQVDEDGEPLDEDLFESTLEIENGDDHRTLVAMMTDLHDPDRSFDSILDQYFDRDNVMAWVATNILLHQADSVRHNFILYNPIGTEKFYFVPWDYDEAMGLWREPPNDLSNDSLRQRLEYGYAVAARNTFLENYYRQPGIHQQILAAVEDLRQNYVTDDAMWAKANYYINLVAPFQMREPDSVHNSQFTTWSAVGLSQNPAENEESLRSRFGLLMAPILADPELQGSQWVFRWQPAYDVTGEAGSVTYRLQVSTTPSFDSGTIIVDIDGIDEATDTVEQRVGAAQLSPGENFARLIATPTNQPERFWQVSGNKLWYNQQVYYGTLRFEVP